MNLPNELTIYFDGLCESINPGGAACYGWLLASKVAETRMESILVQKYGFIEEGPGATNNVAEWCALGFALRYLVNQNWRGKLIIKGDSQLVINQLTSNWNCNAPRLQRLRQRCWEYLEKLGNDYKTFWIPREQNQEADALSRKAYESHTGKQVMERKMNCECGKLCRVSTSQTAKNPNRRFIKCECGKFTWLD